MKKVISIFLSVVMLLSTFSSFTFTVNAGDKNYEYRVDYTTEDGKFLFYVKENDTIVIRKYLGKDSAVTIPGSLAIPNLPDDKYTELPVQELYYYCFTDCNTVKQVTFEGTTVLQSIGNSAFLNCINLEKIRFYNTVEVIFPNAFLNCAKLKDIVYYGTKDEYDAIEKCTYDESNDELFKNINVTYKKTFHIGIDSNSYFHGNGKNAGFENRKNYQFSNKYKQRLFKYMSEGQQKEFNKRLYNEKWEGSCSGVAATMGLAYKGKLPIVNDSSNTYYNMPRPYDYKEFDDVIQYYHQAQNVEEYNKYYVKYINPNWIQKIFCTQQIGSLSEFFSDFLKQLDTKGLTQLSFGYGKDKGHSVVAIDYEIKADGTYDVKIYDENQRLRYSHLYISADKKSFKYNSGKIVNEKTYRYFKYYDFDNYSKVESSFENKTISSYSLNNTYSVTIPSNCDFKIIDENNKTLVYKDGEFSGDKEVYSLDFIDNSSLNSESEFSEIILKFEGSPIFTFVPLSENSTIDVRNDNNYIGFEGSGVNNVKVDVNNYLEITGGTGDFNGYMSKLDENDMAVYSVSGQQGNNIKMYYDNSNVALKSSEDITSLNVERLDLDGSKSLLKNLSADNLLIDNEDTIYSDEVIVSCQHKKIENGKCVKCGEEVSTGGNTGGSTGGGGAAPAPAPTTDETQKDDEKRPELKPDQTQNNSTSATKKLSIKKLISKKKEFTVYWNKITDVSGYQIQVATDKKFKKNKKTFTIKKQNVSKKTVKKLKAKKKYFVRIRAYSVVNGKKVYGKWSKIQSAKTK